MKSKFNKESRNLLIGMLLGDGSISNNYVFKIAHCEQQKDYLEWKIKQLNNAGIRNNGINSYIKTKGYNTGVPVYYSQLKVITFIKLLRKVMYKNKKIIGNRKLLNRLSAREIAIWYMDDGHINIRKDKDGIEKDLQEIYKRFPRLEERKTQLAGTLSGGEQQMLAMGRALMSKPEIILLDEPSMGLSPIFVEEIFDIIKYINESGTTVLLVEQNAKKALSIANRAYVLETGNVVLGGDAKDLMDDDTVKKAYLGE